MKTQHVIGYLFAAIFFLSLQSCIVSKKKYEALEARKAFVQDSLNNVLDQTVGEYNNQKHLLLLSNAQKNSIADSLSSRVNNLSADADELRHSLNEAINDYNREKEKLLTMTKEAEQEHQRLRTNLEEKEKRLSELEQMIEENKKETDKLRRTIADALIAFDASELSVYQKDGKVYVSMEEKLLFKVGSAAIDAKGKEAVEKLSEVLGKNPNIDIVIEGHTDNTGSAAINWKLSTERALSIVKVLEENKAIDPERIVAAGRGMYAPIADNDTPEGRQKNRRIEIILSPKLDSLFDLLNE